MLITNFSTLIIALFILFYSGGMMVRSIVLIGRYLKINEFTLSFVLAAFATSLPEFFIGINAAINNTAILSVGNIIGANVLNATLVLGAATIAAGRLSFNQVVKKEDIQITLGLLLLPILLMLDMVLSRYDGLIFLFFFGGYLIYLFNQERESRKINGETEINEVPNLKTFTASLIKFIAAASLLLISSRFVVSQSLEISRIFSLPLFFIGILIAIGTTLPEMIFSLKSVSLGHKSMAFGNALGSIIINLSLILGSVAAISPITITIPSRIFFGLFLAALIILLTQIIRLIKGYIPRTFGIILLMVAAAFVAIEAFLQ